MRLSLLRNRRVRAVGGGGKSHKGGNSAPLNGLANVTGAWSLSRKLISNYTANSGNFYHETTAKIDTVYDQIGSANQTQATAGARPVVETVNSIAAASFDGVDDFLTGADVDTTLITVSAGYIVASFYLDAVSTNAANVYDNDPVWCDSGNFLGIFLKNAAGVYTTLGYNWDGNADSPTAHAISVATATVVEWRHDAGTVQTRVNGGTWNSTASGNTTSAGNLLWAAETSGGITNFTDMKMFEMVTFNVVPDDATKDALAANLGAWCGAF